MAERGIRQVEIADLLNVSLSTFNMKLIGKSQFTEREIKILADYFGVGVDFLYAK